MENNPHMYPAKIQANGLSQPPAMHQWSGMQQQPRSSYLRESQQVQLVTTPQRDAVQVQPIHTYQPATGQQQVGSTSQGNEIHQQHQQQQAMNNPPKDMYYLKLKAAEELKNFWEKRDDELKMDEMFQDLDSEFDNLDFPEREAVSLRSPPTLQKKADDLQGLEKVQDALEPLLDELNAPTLGELFGTGNDLSLYDQIYRRLTAIVELRTN